MNEENFVKVCPFCYSSNLGVVLSDSASGYACKDCKAHNFWPLELEEKTLSNLKKQKK
ncbi:MAG: hypothetical protein NTY48_07260 [Candidatus Diapherotrites archaeon]|nr:hypothetical protein [Candidatus Diapherotrites archaeon]